MLDTFLKLKHREQLILLFGGVAALLMMLYLLVWAPLAERADNLAVQNSAAAAQLERVDSMASRLQTLRAAGDGGQRRGGGNVSQLVNSRAATYGLKVSRLQPNSRGELQVRFEDVAFNSLLSWMHQLEVSDGLRAREVSITRTSTPGVVSATIRVAAG